MKKRVLVFILCIFAIGLFAQEETQQQRDKTFSFLMFLHGGYGMLPNKTAGLTGTSDDHLKKMSAGASWNAQAFFRVKMLIAGLIYSGYTSKDSYIASETSGLTSSDNILTTYIGPQVGMNIPVAKVFHIGFNGGLGAMWLQNKGTVDDVAFADSDILLRPFFQLSFKQMFYFAQSKGNRDFITIGKHDVRIIAIRLEINNFPQVNFCKFISGIK